MRLVAFYLGNVISKPVVKITAIIKKAENLDLTYDNDFDRLLKSKDEIGQLSNAFNNMRKEFVLLIKQILEKSQAVASIQDTIVKVQGAFKNLSDNSKEVLSFIYENVDPQLESMQKMGDEYYNDAKFVTNMSDEIAAMSEELAATINQVSEAVQSTAETSQQASENAETIKDSINETISIKTGLTIAGY